MNKEEIIQNNKPQYLSAQRYNQLTDAEKSEMRKHLREAGFDVDDYEAKMKKLWPKEHIRTRTWRK